MRDFDLLFKNGNFGIMHKPNNEQEAFVVVNDKLIYESGGFDFINSFKNNKLSYSNNYYIKYIAEAFCFNDIYNVFLTQRLYDRDRDNKEKITEKEINTIYEICYETCDGEIFKCDTAEELLEDVKRFIEDHSFEKNGCVRITLDKIY